MLPLSGPNKFFVVGLSDRDLPGLVEEPIAAIPEPATWAMMLLGFLGVGFMAYRRKGTTMQFRAV